MTKPGRHCRYNTPGPSPPDCYRGRRVRIVTGAVGFIAAVYWLRERPLQNAL